MKTHAASTHYDRPDFRASASGRVMAAAVALRNLTRARASNASPAEVARLARRYAEAQRAVDVAAPMGQIATAACVR